ncbi:MAG: TonB-dependent receptor [Gemmatimonadaceae bacterium]
MNRIHPAAIAAAERRAPRAAATSGTLAGTIASLVVINSRRGGVARLAIAAVLAASAIAASPAAPATRRVLRAQAPAAEVSGRVASDRGTPLADVQLRIEGSARGTLSDAQGRFTIGGLPAGAHVLVAQRIGFAPARVPFTVTAGAPLAPLAVTLREAAVSVAPVVVSATREQRRRAEASATIDVLDAVELSRTRASHPAGILNRIAGVHVAELSGEGHSMAMRQPITTKPMYLYLEDGIPTRATGFFNHNALYEVNIPQAGGVEILKGPGTALYGSDAIGGVVNVLTRGAPVAPTVEGNLEGGAHGYTRVLASAGLTRAGQGVRADLNVTHSDNWKERAPFDRQSGTLRWDAFALRGWTVKTVVTASNIRQQDVPSVDSALYRRNPAFNRAPIAYRTVQALRASSAWELERGASLFSVTPYIRRGAMGLLPSWQLTYDPQTWDTRNSSLGLLLKYRRDLPAIGGLVIAGADLDRSPGHFTARQAVTAPVHGRWSSYTNGELEYDYDVRYAQFSPYLHAEATPLARLRLDAGLRADLSGYAYDSRLAPLATGAHRRPADTTLSYTHLSPKVGATYDVGGGTSLFGSYRHGFRAPSQSQLFQQNSAANTVGLRPVMVDSWETGVRGSAGRRMVYQVSAYDMTIRDDIVTFITESGARVATNAGETRHRGVEASAGAALARAVRLDVAWSVSRQRYVDWQPRAGTSFAGKLMEQAPRDLGSVLLTWSPALLHGGRVAAEWSHTGGYAMDPANTQWYEGHDLLALHANAILGGRTELFARVSNLGNVRYAELASVDPSRRDPAQRIQYTPGAPRMVYLGVKRGWSR